MTQHDLLAFLDASHAHYGFWPSRRDMGRNLRLNTPEGESAWDTQLTRALIPMLRDGLVEWSGCGARGCRHLVLTAFGADTLKAWNKLGCRAHGARAANCGKRKTRNLLPAVAHEARAA